MSGEYVAAAADALRDAGALDVVLIATTMKKGRPGTRFEILTAPDRAGALERLLLTVTTTIGVRRVAVERRALPRERRIVRVLDHDVAVKVVTIPGGARRAKPEFEDVRRVAEATARPMADIFSLAAREAERPADGERP
jgi:uncharacterized protein (DUF111 family)